MSNPQHPYGQHGPYGQQPYGAQPYYGQTPYGAQPPQMGGPFVPPSLASPPASIRRARWAMWVGAFLTMLYTPAAGVDMRVVDPTEWEDLAREVGDASTSEGLFIAFMAIGILCSALMALVWVLIAHFTTKGAEWARITGTVLFVLWAVLFLCGLLAATIGLALVVNVLLVLAGAAAVVFLWLPDSSAWFRQRGLIGFR